MIQANEAIVGRIFDRKHGKGRTQTTLTENMIGLIFSSDKGLALNDFEPIPLTPEILEKCGFEKQDDGDGGYYRELLSENGILFVEGDKKGYTDVFIDCWEQIRVRYLHQLQNLYYSLTGTELNYQP